MVKETRFYDVLEVAPTADLSEIRRSFRAFAKRFHPDKNPEQAETSTEKFKEAAYIFGVLEDPQKRKTYDLYGEAGLNNARLASETEWGDTKGDYASQMFKRFFGGPEVFSQPKAKKGRDVTHKLVVSLEDLYKGKTARLMVQKTVICPTCSGHGGKEGKVFTCLVCNGRGVVCRGQQVGPRLTQQVSLQCDVCHGEGFLVDEKDRCKTCNAVRTIPESKVLDVMIEPGMSHGHRIVLPHEADQQPGIIPGDIIIVLEQKAHAHFVRRGNDLLTTQIIELSQALCGFQFAIQHLDGRPLVMCSRPGEVMRERYMWNAKGHGMPIYGKPDESGQLLINFQISFPQDNFASPEMLAELSKLLPPPKPLPPGIEGAKHVTLQCLGQIPPHTNI
eukprot:Ihof_evm3s75 gene=Ihof_evmTU3s75